MTTHELDSGCLKEENEHLTIVIIFIKIKKYNQNE